ncbi:MAG: ABC transporter substrate-binding protein [Chloroflexi bacterium]|nr:ABC transporter substrate-binding protein [Chloroflexota bacterium]
MTKGFLYLGLLVALLGSLLVYGCQSAAPSPSPEKKAESPKAEVAEVSTLKIGNLPVANGADVLAAEKLGYFKDEGLTVESTMAMGAEGLQAVVAGKLNFVGATFISVPTARAEGIDFVVVAGRNGAQKAPPDSAALMVLKDGPIQSAKDLEGKRIGINLLNNVNWLYARELVARNGVDPKKITFAEIGFPQMGDALYNKQVDAVFSTEPFTMIMRDSGKARALSYPFVEIEPGLNIAQWIASEKWVKANPIATRKFARAMTRTIEYLNSNPEEKLKLIAEYTKQDAEVLRKTTLDVLSTKVDVKSLQNQIALMVKHEMLKQSVDASTMMWETAK